MKVHRVCKRPDWVEKAKTTPVLWLHQLFCALRHLVHDKQQVRVSIEGREDGNYFSVDLRWKDGGEYCKVSLCFAFADLQKAYMRPEDIIEERFVQILKAHDDGGGQ